MSVECEQHFDEVTGQVRLLYDNLNFKYCILSVSGTELRTNRRRDDPITRCPWQTFQTGDMKSAFDVIQKLLQMSLKYQKLGTCITFEASASVLHKGRANSEKLILNAWKKPLTLNKVKLSLYWNNLLIRIMDAKLNAQTSKHLKLRPSLKDLLQTNKCVFLLLHLHYNSLTWQLTCNTIITQ